MLTSIDVKFIFDSARFGLFSTAKYSLDCIFKLTETMVAFTLEPKEAKKYFKTSKF